MLPFLSKTTPPPGPKPSVPPVKLYRTLKFQLPPECLSVKTVPQPSPVQVPPLPPATAVPYRLPLESKVTPPYGAFPSLPPVKLCSTVSVHLPLEWGVNLKTVPRLEVPPTTVVP